MCTVDESSRGNLRTQPEFFGFYSQQSGCDISSTKTFLLYIIFFLTGSMSSYKKVIKKQTVKMLLQLL